MTMMWLIYYDSSRMMWDAVPDESEGGRSVGSNWSRVTRELAAQFVRRMQDRAEWTRGHDCAPRF
jgi:hypothetical protein